MSWLERLRASSDPNEDQAKAERLLEGCARYVSTRHHAHHEAGHAVVAVYFGWPFSRVWIAQDSLSGKVEDIRYETEHPVHLVALSLAGPVAQANFIGWDYWELLTTQVDSGDTSFVADFDKIAELLGKDRDLIAREDLAEAHALVMRIFEDQRGLLAAIASNLDEKFELSYEEVLALR